MRNNLILTLVVATAGWAHAHAQAQPAPPAKSPRKAEVASPAPIEAPRAKTHDQLIEDARQKLQAGDTARALALAQEARRGEPNSYKAAYYIAYALMIMGDFDGATQGQQRSLQLAESQEQKAPVQALGVAIAARSGVREADMAAEDGLDAKAARLYKSAFDAGLERPDIALKAAQLYEQRLKDPGTAVALLRAVLERFPNTASANTAAAELVRLKPALAAVAQEKMRMAQQLPPGSRRELLEDALATDPGNAEVLLSLANDAAVSTTDWPQMEARVKTLLKARLLEDSIRTGKLKLRTWQADLRLQKLLEDAWGSDAVKQVLAESAAEELRRSAAGKSCVNVSGTTYCN